MEPTFVKILEYISSSSMGGAEHGLLRDTEELVRRGHEVSFISPRGRELTAALESRGSRVWAPRTFGKIDPWTVLRTAVLLRSRGIDVVHTHLSTASLLGSIAARLAGIPCIATVHGLNSAFCYRFVRGIVAVSGAVKKHLESQGVPGRRIHVNYNGVDFEHFSDLPNGLAARGALRIEPQQPIMLYVGRLSPEKGVHLLPSILQQVQRTVPSAQLVVVGTGTAGEALRAEMAERDLLASCRMLGYRDDTRPLLAAADILIVPSYREGLPFTLLEAMAAGLPCVATDAGGISEALVPGVTGEIVPVGEVDELAKSCALLLQDAERRRRMSAAARERILDKFSIARSVTGIEEILRESLVRRQAVA